MLDNHAFIALFSTGSPQLPRTGLIVRTTLAAATSLPALLLRSAAKASANVSASCRASKVATGNSAGSIPLLIELPVLRLHVR